MLVAVSKGMGAVGPKTFAATKIKEIKENTPALNRGLTQPCIPPGSLNRVPVSAGGKGWNVISTGWQVTLCDPIWHVSSNSGVATSVRELLYPCYFTLLYCAIAVKHVPKLPFTGYG